MAGLLDIFGTSGQDTMGLLGMSPEDIKRSRDDAQAQALYALAGRLFQGGRGGASIVEGLQQGQQAYRTAMQGGLQQQLQAAQIQELKKKRELEQQALMRQQGVENLISQAYRPETFADTPLTNLIGQEIAGPNMPQAAGLGLEALAPKLMATPEGRKALTELIASQKAMGGETTTLAEGANLIRVNPITNKVETVAQGAPKREPVPSSIAEYNLAKSQGFTGTFQAYELAKQAVPSGSIKEFQDFSKLTPPEQAAYLRLQEQKRPVTNVNVATEGERKAATLASRLNFSVGQLNQAIGADPKAAMPNTAAEISRFVSRTEFLPNKINTEQRQIVEAAQSDILDAALTLGTGAAYTREQLEGYKKSYFPQLGDSAATVKTKQERLTNLLKSAEIASGRAANQITAPIPAPVVPKQQIETSPFKYEPAKEDRYQQWLKKQQGG
jgi:hypothetical protein